MSILTQHFGYAQWSKQETVTLLGIDKCSQDQSGNIYVTTSGGEVKKYSESGKFLAEFSAALTGRIHQIDASSQLRILVFYEDLQEYVLLDRYLRSPSRYALRDFGVGFVSEIAINAQQNIWVIDQSDFTLKLLDPRRNSILEKKSLAKILDENVSQILSLTVHQNTMYIVDEEKRVLIFDSIGNFVGNFDSVNKEDFWFYQDYICHVSDSALVCKNIYSAKTVQLDLPKKGFSKALYNGVRLVLFSDQGFEIYKYLSPK